jgi:predicted Fe-Mo cluster-binding NifX family protein
MRFEAIANPERDTLRGAGTQVADLVVEREAQAVVTGHVGPNAFRVLQASGIPVYLSADGTVREAIAAHESGRLDPVAEADAPTHSGTKQALDPCAGRDLAAVPPVPSGPFASREEEVTVLREMAKELRDRLAQVSRRLDGLGETAPAPPSAD